MAKSSKGSSFERETCRLLSRWFTRGERDDIFWRTAGSGARATCRMKSGLMTADSAGDICAMHEIGKPLTRVCLFELKKGYSSPKSARKISLLAFLDNLPKERNPLLLEWADKIEKESKAHNRRFWFIIFKRDRKQAVICMNKETFDKINRRNPEKYMWPPFGPVTDLYVSDRIFRLMLFDDFLRWCRPETIQRRIRRRGKPISQERWEQEIFRWKEPNNKTKPKKRKLRRRK